MLLHYLGKLKIWILCRYLANVEENANKLHFKCTNFNSSTRVTVYSEGIYVFLPKSCSRHWIPCWLLINTAVTNLQCHKVIAIVNKFTKEQRYGKYLNVWMNNKGRSDKNAICLHFLPHVPNICRKFIFSISQGSVATCPRWGGGVVQILYQISYPLHQCKNFENRLSFDKGTESLKVGTFLRHSVEGM